MDGSLNVVGSDATTPRHLDAAESGRLERSHSQGHSRPKQAIHGVSALPPLATELRTTPEVRFVPILLHKSFCGMGLKFSEAWARRLNNDVGDHVATRTPSGQ